MTFTSYAQNYEDVTLFRALKGVRNGFYIDVGAQDPIVDSVTRAFYERGWRGINIEPVDYWFNKLLADRPKDHNLKVAAAAEAGTLRFYEVVNTGLSTANADFAKQHIASGFEVRETEVPARRLDDICDELSATEIHFLKIDVEGAEGAVLAGIDLTRIRPWVILVESTEPNSTAPTHMQWEELLTTRGYVFVYCDGLNRYYVPRERKRQLKAALSTPPNYFDHFIRYSEWRARQHAQRMEAEATDANNRLEALESELIQSRSQGDALRAGLADAQQHAARIEGQLAQSRERLEALESELIQSRIQSDALRESLDDAQQHVTYVEGMLAQSNEQFYALESELIQSQSQGDALRESLSAVKAKIDELNYHSHHWWTVADGFNRELQAVYASRSWRLTVPLRKASVFVKQPARMTNTAISALACLPRRAVRRMLLSALAHVQARPERKAKVTRLLEYLPRLNARLGAFAWAHKGRPTMIVPSSTIDAMPAPPADSSGAGIRWAAYSPSVRNAYQQLMQARARTHADTAQEKKTENAA